jgi:hypothetical protein
VLPSVNSGRQRASVMQLMQVTDSYGDAPVWSSRPDPCAADADGSLTVITCERQRGSCIASLVMGLGTTWGPHALHASRRPARRLIAGTALAPPRASTDAYSYVLGVKGSSRLDHPEGAPAAGYPCVDHVVYAAFVASQILGYVGSVVHVHHPLTEHRALAQVAITERLWPVVKN